MDKEETVSFETFEDVEKAVEADDGYHSVSNNWDVLFSGEDFVPRIKKLGIEGCLRGCCFRSVCWKLYLGILPHDRAEWVKATQDSRREYAKVKQEYLEDPRSRANAADATFNNPLSLDEESPWNQFFQDEELRKMISQDVQRTHPDLDFFQMERIRLIMCNVLFCFARANKDLGYRQGIHELLAPIIFVLDSDKRDKDTVPAGQSYTDEMICILNGDHMEADAYCLLSALMETCTQWYEYGQADTRVVGKKSPVATDQTKLFQGEEDLNPSSAVVRKLEKIQQLLIKREDPELHSHLAKLAIPPQIFGLRWVRLLFAREFAQPDILLLWDAIFAHSQTLELVDSIILAMLLFIRDPLISSTYVDVLQLLLNFPVVADVQYIIQRALFLNNPNLYPRPPNWQLSSSDSRTTLSAPVGLRNAGNVNGSRLTAVRSGVSHVTQGAKSLAGKTVGLFTKVHGASPPASGSRSVFYGDSQDSVMTSASPSSVPAAAAAPSSSASSAGEPATSSFSVPSARPAAVSLSSETATGVATSPMQSESSAFAQASSADADSAASGPNKQMTHISRPPAEQLSCWMDICKLCSVQMNACIATLEQQLVENELPGNVDDKMFLSLAGLKQVRDVLRGTLGYNLSVEEVESILALDILTNASSQESTADSQAAPKPEDSTAASQDS